MSKAVAVLFFMTFNIGFLTWYLLAGQLSDGYRRRRDKPLIVLAKSPLRFRLWQAFLLLLIATSVTLWLKAFGEVF